MPKGNKTKGNKMVDPHQYYDANDSIINIIKKSDINQYLLDGEFEFIENLNKKRNEFLHESYGLLSTHDDDDKMPLYLVTAGATDEATEFLQKKLKKLLNKICDLCADLDKAMGIMKTVEILVAQR